MDESVLPMETVLKSASFRQILNSTVEQATSEQLQKLSSEVAELKGTLAESSRNFAQWQHDILRLLDEEDAINNGDKLQKGLRPRTPTESFANLLNAPQDEIALSRGTALETRPERGSAWKRRLGRLLKQHKQSNISGASSTLPPTVIPSTLLQTVIKPPSEFQAPAQAMSCPWELPKMQDQPLSYQSICATVDSDVKTDAKFINFPEAEEEISPVKSMETPEKQKIFRQALVRYSDEYKMQESVWEMTVMFGTGWISWSGNIQLILAFMVNFIIQFILACVIWATFSVTDNMDIDVEGLLKWRVTAAHNYLNVDPITDETLISRVCRYDATLGIYTNYVFILNDIDVYNAPLWPATIGTMLCSIVVLIWVFTVVDDALDCLSFLHGIICVPKDLKTRLHCTYDDNALQELEFSTITWRRVVFVIVSCFLRIGIAIVFLFVGCKWLAHTYDFASLLLNSVALAFVFHLDELCFEILVPVDVITVREIMKPLPLRLQLSRLCPIFNSSDITRIPLLLAAIGFFVYIWFAHIHPRTEELLEAQEALCGGKLDFATGYDGRTKLLYTAPTTASKERQLWPDGIPKEIPIIKELTDDDNYLKVDGVAHMDGVAELRQAVQMDIKTYVEDLYDDCIDTIETAPSYVLLSVQRHNSNPNGTTCEDLTNDCFQLDQLLLRMYCPVSCGATSPRSGLFLDSAARGIPQNLCRATQNYQNELNAITCADLSKSELDAQIGWSRGWTLMLDFWSSRVTEKRKACFETVESMFLSDGCNAVAELPSLSCLDDDYKVFCDGDPDILNVALFCPVACGCIAGTNKASACPPSCTR